MSGSLNAKHSLKRFRRARSQRAFKRPRTRTKYGYDTLDRTTSGLSSNKTRSYTFDANGNRLTYGGTTAYSETFAPTSNLLSSISGAIVRTYAYDAAGNTMSYTGASFTFNQRGRMSSTTVTGVGTTNYVYNAIGQMIEKSGNGGTTLIVYDEAGHIIGEYSSTGALIEETIWMGDTPVATLQPSSGVVTLYYVHTDHLNTPRKVTRASDNILMWRWDPDAMSGVSPITSPTGRAPFTYNLLYPGQYLLNESGLYYNYFRTYDPRVGSYLESDPIGLAGGSYSTYAYAGGNALSNIDPSGLEVRYMCRPLDLTSKAHHCFVYVTCPEEGWSHVYSLFPYYILGSSARKYDMRDDPASASVTYNSLISPKSFPNESLSCQRCQFEKAVRERYDSFTSGDVFYSAAFGPNSNSFANGLLDLPTWGVSAPIVPSAPAQQFGWSLWGQPRNPSYVPAR
jgi:RHS repeat-associated protein